MNRVYNFSAGPSALPLPVLQQVQKELLNYQDSGMSVMEMSHRGEFFTEIIESATCLFKELMKIPDHYSVLFMQGGASLQFSAVPLNLVSEKKSFGYIDTGVWSDKAIQEAKKIGTVKILASSREANYNYIPEVDNWEVGDLDYIHITTNNTIYGTCFPDIPNLKNTPLVADMSSDILSKEYDVSKFGIIYAGAQKNLGPSGLAVVIIKNELLDRSKDDLPSLLNYKLMAANQSLYNTPNTFGIYVCQLVLKWVKELGGVKEIEKINKEKAAILYDFLDNSKLFKATVKDPFRSIMNIPFITGSKELDDKFVVEAEKSGLAQLKGHRSVGGMRASIYNAMPIKGVEALVDFMKHFELRNA